MAAMDEVVTTEALSEAAGVADLSAPSWWQALLTVVGLAGSLAIPFWVATPLEGNGRLAALLVSAALGAFSVAGLHVWYRQWINPQRWLGAGRWVVVQTIVAVVAVGVMCASAYWLRHASAVGSRPQALAAVIVGIVGVVPMNLVVRADVSAVPGGGPHTPAKRTRAWSGNAAFVVIAAVVPLWFLSQSSASFLLSIPLAVLWLVGLVLERWQWIRRRFGRHLLPAGLLIVLVPLTAATALRPTWHIPAQVILGVLFAMALGFRFTAASQSVIGRARNPLSIFGWARSAWIDRLVISTALAIPGGIWMYRAAGGDGVRWYLVAAAIAVPLLLGVSMITRGEGLLALVLVGSLVLWTVPNHALDAPPERSGDYLIYAFGDSYMSGEGTGVFEAGTDTVGPATYAAGGPNECRQSSHAYMHLVVDSIPGTVLAFNACSGAVALSDETTKAMRDAGQDRLAAPKELKLSPEQLTKLRAESAGDEVANTIVDQVMRMEAADQKTGHRPNLIMVSLGGNDAHFSKIGRSCFMPGSCDVAVAGSREAGIEEVGSRVALALATVAEAYPGVPIGVVAYPQMFGPDIAQCAGQIPFDRAEAEELAGFVNGLNGAVASAIEAVNVRLVEDQKPAALVHLTSTESAFGGFRLCELGDEVDRSGERTLVEPVAINTLKLVPSSAPDLLVRLQPSKWVHNTFHPTIDGHKLLAARVAAWVECTVEDQRSDCNDEATNGQEVAPPLGSPGLPPVNEKVTASLECSDLDSYEYCALVASLRTVSLAVAMLLLSGAYLARAGSDRFRSPPPD